MKNNGNYKFKSLRLISICLLFALSLFSCSPADTYEDEINAIAGFLTHHEDFNSLTINALEKYEVSEKEIFYYVEWQDEKEETKETYELLLVYDRASSLVKLRHFSDMEQGLYSNIKAKWDEIKGNPNRKFSDDEINKIKKRAIISK